MLVNVLLTNYKVSSGNMPTTCSSKYVPLNARHTLYNVCSVHRGMFSTPGGVQYIGGYHEYIGGIS